MAEDGSYFSALFSSGACTSFTLDALILAVSFLVWMGSDAYKLGFSTVSIGLLVVLSFVLAISYTGPIYLALRTVRIERLEHQLVSSPAGGLLDFILWASVLGIGALARFVA